MKGTLTEQPLAELLRELLAKGLSGTLRLEHERVQAAVYFENGEVVYAAANLRALRLREYLSKRGLVSEKELASVGENLSDLRLAAALGAKGVSEKELNAQLAAVVTDVLRVTLLWTEGAWTFNARARLDEPVRLKIDTALLLREAAQRLPMNLIALRFRNPAETFSRAAAAVSVTSNILPAESFLLSRLDQPAKLADVVTLSSLPQFKAYRVLYGLALSGLVEREFWQNAFRTGPAKTPEKISAPAAPQVPVSATEPTESRWTTVDTEESELEDFLRRLSEAVNYYEVIQMPTTASADEIKNAYYALARRYHPDRFHLKSGTPLHAKISSAFARITQAYETLTDANARLAYDQAMERARQFAKTTAKPAAPEADVADEINFDEASHAASESDRPEYNFREGVAALQQGRINAAITYLASAARLLPDEARYRAHYGRALAASDATRRLAENEMQAAVKLEPGNADFRTMLAELYFELKFNRRAQTEVDRALALDPNHALARSLLRKLEKSRKVG